MLGKFRQYIQVNGVILKQELVEHFYRKVLVTLYGPAERFNCVKFLPQVHCLASDYQFESLITAKYIYIT